MIAFGIIAIAVVYGAVRLLTDYLQRSQRSFASAQIAWNEVDRAVLELLDSDVPAVVAQLAILIARLTGCGCFVRGVLMSHYLPRFTVKPKPQLEVAFASLNELSPKQKKLFDQVIATAVVYDSYRNPLIGGLFRRLVKSAIQSQHTYSATLETQLAAAAVLSRKDPVALAA